MASEEMRRPAPYPSDTRAKGWRFELDYEKIEQSDTWSLAAEVPMAQHSLLMMWMMAWTQVPCGSLPNDTAIIRAKCKVPPKMWPALQPVLMRGWWQAEDGRLYHDTIVLRVIEMLSERNKGSYRRFRSVVLERDGARCAYCGIESSELTLDHIIPRSKGGPDSAENLTPACRSCNSSKGAKGISEWAGGTA